MPRRRLALPLPARAACDGALPTRGKATAASSGRTSGPTRLKTLWWCSIGARQRMIWRTLREPVSG